MQHQPVLDVDEDVAPRAIVAHEGVQRVALRHPLYEARVGGERHDGVALDAEVEASAAGVHGEQRVDQAKELHHALVLPQVLVTLK